MAREQRVAAEFRERFKALRDERNWSQADVAKMLADRGISLHPTAIAKIEAGEREVKIDEAAAIAALFDVSIDALVGRRVGLQNDLAYMLHAALETAGNLALQTATMAGILHDRFRDLGALEFAGYKAVYAEAERAWKALNDANDALWKLRMFELPPGTAIGLREAVLDQAASEKLITLLNERAGNETQS
jgi:transcriptional regulator with XRE-family HTH domain